MQLDLKLDGCKMSVFWSNWIMARGDCAVLNLTQYQDYNEYFAIGLNATKRNDYRKSIKRGYRSRPVDWVERNTMLDQIHEIHTSLKIRQGREMRATYLQDVKPVGRFECREHAGQFYGCFLEKKLTSYVVTSRMGEAWMLSMIIGHGDYLKNFIMVNVCLEVIWRAFEEGIKCIIYHRWDNGTAGLQFWKQSIGFRPAKLEI